VSSFCFNFNFIQYGSNSNSILLISLFFKNLQLTFYLFNVMINFCLVVFIRNNFVVFKIPRTGIMHRACLLISIVS
jgi:hypothetical protein